MTGLFIIQLNFITSSSVCLVSCNVKVISGHRKAAFESHIKFLLSSNSDSLYFCLYQTFYKPYSHILKFKTPLLARTRKTAGILYCLLAICASARGGSTSGRRWALPPPLQFNGLLPSC